MNNTNGTQAFLVKGAWRLLASLALWLLPCAGIVLLRLQSTAQPQPSSAAVKSVDPANEVAALRAELEQLKGKLPDQSHAMKDVGYHFANLWFAGQRKNWPLADFYASETRSHLRWAVRIIPVRKDPQGNEIRLLDILDPIERTALKELQDTIKAGDGAKFTAAYKQMMDSCYSCHLLS